MLATAILCAAALGTASAHAACRGTDPRCYHDWAKDKRERNRVLIYTRTAGPRHSNLGPPLAAGLNPSLDPGNVVQTSLRTWLGRAGVAADWTEDVTRLTNLHRYKAVIFASTSRDALFAHGRAIDPTLAINTSTGASLDAARTALRQYVRAGGGFVGIHNAFGTEYNWPWYEGLLGDTSFYDHGDEKASATRQHLHPGHGDLHPVAWCHYHDGGRAWLTTLGHDAAAFTEGSEFPGQREFEQLLVNGIRSAMGLIPFCTK